MLNPRHALTVGALTAVAALGFAPAALANTDPVTCTDGLTSLLKVRTSEGLSHTRVTVAERADAQAQADLRAAAQDDRNARDELANADNAWGDAKRDLAAATPEQRPAAEAREQAAHDRYNQAQARAYAAHQRFADARVNADRKRSYLAEVRLDLGRDHRGVLHINVLVDQLCGRNGGPTVVTPVPPAPVDTTEPAAPVDTTTPAEPSDGDQVTDVPTGPVRTGATDPAQRYLG